MSRIKSKKYNGIYLNHLANKDVSYSITCKDDFKKLIRFTVGKKSQGITEIYAYNKRNEFIKQKELKIVNPCVGISKLRTDNDREHYLSTSEVKQLLSDINDFRALLFMKLSLSTGGRLQTILLIKKI